MGFLDKIAFWKQDTVPGPSATSGFEAESDPAAGHNLGLDNDNTGLGSNTGLGDGLGGGDNLNLGNNDGLGQRLDSQQPPQGGLPGSSGNMGQPMHVPKDNLEEGSLDNPSAFDKFQNKTNQTMQPQMKQGDDMLTLSKNIEIVSSKIDTIKALLDNLSNRIEKIERIAEGEQPNQQPNQRNNYNRW